MAQAPAGTPSSVDQNRVPIYGGPNAPSVLRQPPIGNFPQAPVAPNTMNQYRPPRPGLNPYLNLYRGTGGIGGVGAVDYYNFVRPAQQSLGMYAGRQMGPYNPSGRYGYFTQENEQLPPETVTHSAGSAATFMNTGPYFNSMNTIGPGAAMQQQQQQRPQVTTGRRR